MTLPSGASRLKKKKKEDLTARVMVELRPGSLASLAVIGGHPAGTPGYQYAFGLEGHLKAFHEGKNKPVLCIEIPPGLDENSPEEAWKHLGGRPHSCWPGEELNLAAAGYLVVDGVQTVIAARILQRPIQAILIPTEEAVDILKSRPTKLQRRTESSCSLVDLADLLKQEVQAGHMSPTTLNLVFGPTGLSALARAQLLRRNWETVGIRPDEVGLQSHGLRWIRAVYSKAVQHKACLPLLLDVPKGVTPVGFLLQQTLNALAMKGIEIMPLLTEEDQWPPISALRMARAAQGVVAWLSGICDALELTPLNPRPSLKIDVDTILATLAHHAAWGRLHPRWIEACKTKRISYDVVVSVLEHQPVRVQLEILDTLPPEKWTREQIRKRTHALAQRQDYILEGAKLGVWRPSPSRLEKEAIHHP